MHRRLLWAWQSREVAKQHAAVMAPDHYRPPIALDTMLPGCALPTHLQRAALRCYSSATAAGPLLHQACLDEVRGVVRLSGPGLVHFLQVRRRCLPPPPAAAACSFRRALPPHCLPAAC